MVLNVTFVVQYCMYCISNTTANCGSGYINVCLETYAALSTKSQVSVSGSQKKETRTQGFCKPVVLFKKLNTDFVSKFTYCMTDPELIS